MSTDDVLTHGVLERRQASSADDRAIEEIARDGFTVVRGALRPEEVAYASKGLDLLYAEQVDQFGAENMETIKDKYIVRSMLVFDDFFLHKVACNGAVTEI